MAYPVVSAPYGLRPVSSLGNSNFTGTTREFPISYGYSTSIFYGDVVGLTRGNCTRLAVTSGNAAAMSGVFMGCYYTDPTTKQQRFSQYWPASTLAGDAVAIVCDDPNVIYKVVVCSSGTTIASGNPALIGQNLVMLNNTGSTATGNSANAAQIDSPTVAPPTTATFPLRCVGLVKETAVSLGSSLVAGSISTKTYTVGALPQALPIGTDYYVLAANGQKIPSGSFIGTAAAAGATSVITNVAPLAAITDSVMYFTQYPEILVKLNFGQHQYDTGLSIA